MRLASAVLSKHVRDPASDVTLPRHVEIQLPPAKFELTIDMPDVQINQLTADPRELFAKPSYSGYNEIDLAQPTDWCPPRRRRRTADRTRERRYQGAPYYERTVRGFSLGPCSRFVSMMNRSP